MLLSYFPVVLLSLLSLLPYYCVIVLSCPLAIVLPSCRPAILPPPAAADANDADSNDHDSTPLHLQPSRAILKKHPHHRSGEKSFLRPSYRAVGETEVVEQRVEKVVG